MDRKENRNARHERVRKKVKGTGERPRLAVFKSASHIYAQLIDDVQSTTIVSASTIDPAFKKQMSSTGNIAAAKLVGQMIAERAKEKGVEAIIFDRGGFIYHGRIKALAEAARETGLKF
ncbi:MAG: 50S ribosomal protein L18 [bacterium]